MSQAQFILRIVTGILFLAAAVLFYRLSAGERILERIALVFLLVGLLNFALTLVLNRIFARLKKGGE